MREVAGRGLFPLLLLLALAGCGDAGQRAARGPGDAAARLFELAGRDDPGDDELRALFIVARLEDDRAALLDAIAGLPEDARVANAVVEPLSGPDEVVADLEVELAGGGAAAYSARLRRIADGEWRIDWFSGPGVEWPAAHGGGEPGLTVSRPPE